MFKETLAVPLVIGTVGDTVVALACEAFVGAAVTKMCGKITKLTFTKIAC